jgi:hypothetical protein
MAQRSSPPHLPWAAQQPSIARAGSDDELVLEENLNPHLTVALLNVYGFVPIASGCEN